MSMDITLPEVKAHTQTARFFRDGKKDKIEIKFVGSKDTLIQTVTPVHMATYKAEWDAFCDGRPAERRHGTPLTDLPAISEPRAADYIHRNVHNLEELAALNDGQCQALGHGTLTDRKGARELVSTRMLQIRDKLQREVQTKSVGIGAVPAEKYAGGAEVEALKGEVAEMKEGMVQVLRDQGLILELLRKRQGGRPKKEKAPD